MRNWIDKSLIIFININKTQEFMADFNDFNISLENNPHGNEGDAERARKELNYGINGPKAQTSTIPNYSSGKN